MKQFDLLSDATREWLSAEGFTAEGSAYYMRPEEQEEDNPEYNPSELQDFRNLQMALPEQVVSFLGVRIMYHSHWPLLNQTIQAVLKYWEPALSCSIATPLGRAVLRNNLTVAEELLAKGALRFDEDLEDLSHFAHIQLNELRSAADYPLAILGQFTTGDKLRMLKLLLPHITLTEELLASASELLDDDRYYTSTVRTFGSFFGLPKPSENSQLLDALNKKWQEQGNDSFLFII